MYVVCCVHLLIYFKVASIRNFCSRCLHDWRGNKIQNVKCAMYTLTLNSFIFQSKCFLQFMEFIKGVQLCEVTFWQKRQKQFYPNINDNVKSIHMWMVFFVRAWTCSIIVWLSCPEITIIPQNEKAHTCHGSSCTVMQRCWVNNGVLKILLYDFHKNSQCI